MKMIYEIPTMQIVVFEEIMNIVTISGENVEPGDNVSGEFDDIFKDYL